MIDNGEKIGRLGIPVLQVGDRNNVLLSDIVKFLNNFKGELFVEVDPWCSERVVTGQDYFNRVVLHRVVLNIAFQHNVVVLHFAGKFYT